MGVEQTAASINPSSLGCTWEAEPLTRARAGILQSDAEHSEVGHQRSQEPHRLGPAGAGCHSLPVLINKLGHA